MKKVENETGSTPSESPDVFAFVDYRAFLRAFYAFKKANSHGYSFRAFSRRAGLKSPNYLKLVMEGDRNLTGAMAERFAAATGLRDDALNYFTDLVAFNQARTGAERNRHYDRLKRFRRYRMAHQLDLAHAEYHSTWYIPAIRELAARPDFRADAKWVATTLNPSISKSDAERALEILFSLELITRGEDGKVSQTEKTVSTGPETFGLHISNYHRMMLERASESIDTIANTERDISSLTLCLGDDAVGILKARLQQFRKELLEMCEMEPSPTQVVQVNFQLFPLSKNVPLDGAEPARKVPLKDSK